LNQLIITRGEIDEIIARARPHSDIPGAYLPKILEAFVEAHQRSPGGLSIEVGTRCGGSAMMFLELLKLMYKPEDMPMLWTVDPYGQKPYHGGDVKGCTPYGNWEFGEAKKLLASYVNHVHWYMTSHEFFSRVALGACEKCEGRDFHTYWWHGEKRSLEDHITFAFLDGEHDVMSVATELAYLRQDDLLRHDGTIVIDNVDVDPLMLSELRFKGEQWLVDLEEGGPYAVLRFKGGVP
jgi:hypothetical protein